MASTSLGTLTLNLAVRLSEFTDGLTRAERETEQRARNMGDSVRNFRDRVMEDLGGTPIGGVIDSLNDKLSALSGGGIAAGGALAGMAVGGVVVATGALVALALETAKADVQLQIMASTANVGLRSFQVLTHAAAGLGVEQEALAAILADVQEKLGEFSATGGGGAADFFEALQNNTKATDEEIRNLGQTLQGKDGVEAIQLLKDEMDALGATSQEQRFVFESLAGDLGNLMPLFADGGNILNKYGVELEAAGVIKTEAAIEQSRKLTAQTQAVTTQFEGFKTQLAVQMMPVLNSLMGYFVDGKTKGGDFGSVMESVGIIAKTVGAGIISVAGGIKLMVRMIQAFGEQVANVGITTSNFFDADGFVAKANALKQGASAYYDINTRLGEEFVSEFTLIKNAISGIYTPANAALTGLAGANYELSQATDARSKGLKINTVDAEENAKAQDALAKATGKTAKSVKELGSAYVSNTALSGLKLKSNEAIAGGKARGYTAEFAELTQSLIGGNLKYFSAINDTYHKGTSSKHATGQAFDIVLKDAKKAKQAVAQIKAAAKEYGYQVKILDEYAKPSKNATGGHLHVSVYGQKDNGKGGADLAWIRQQNSAASSEMQKAAIDAQRKQEELERAKLSITNQYATAKEKIELDHSKNVLAIKAAYAEDSIEYSNYMAREENEYIEKKTAVAKSILEQYMVGQERLTYEHNQKLMAINKEFAEGDPSRALLVDLQNAAYQKDLENFKFAAQAKSREQDKLYQSIANSAKANGITAASTGLDSMAQRTMSADDYSVWRLGQDQDEGFDSVNNQYANRQSEINATDERGEFNLPELERFELLEIAKQEHLDNMWSMEQQFALRTQSLEEQQAAQRVAIQENAFSAMTSVAAIFFGENSKMQKVAFAMEKAYAVQKALMNVKETYSNTFNALSAIPLIGPYIAMPGAVAASAIQIAQAAGIGGMAAPSVAGIAHGGLDYVPKESTYLLDEGERVLSPNQNKDFTNFIANGQSSNNGNITINNNSSAEVRATRGPNGEVTVEMVDKMIEKSFRRIGRANSIESKSIQRHTTARVKR